MSDTASDRIYVVHQTVSERMYVVCQIQSVIACMHVVGQIQKTSIDSVHGHADQTDIFQHKEKYNSQVHTSQDIDYGTVVHDGGCKRCGQCQACGGEKCQHKVQGQNFHHLNSINV